MRRLLGVQICLLALCATGMIIFWDMNAGVAAAFGGVIAIANSLLLARSVLNAGRAALKSSKAGMAHLYYGFMGRFAIVLIGMTLGVMYWELSALPMIVGITVVSLGAALTERLT